MATPLASALRQIFGDQSNVVVADYQYSFATLWQYCLRPGSPEISGKSAMVIVGIEPPGDTFFGLIPENVDAPVNFQQHFTAYSWAAAYRLRNPNSSTTVVIINHSADSAGGPAADLRKLYAEEQARNTGIVPGIICLNRVSLVRILAAVSDSPAQPLEIGQKAMLRGIIQGHLVPDPEKHHQLGNVAGALMLTTREGNARTAGKVALSGLLQALQPATGFVHATNSAIEFDQRLKQAFAAGPAVALFDDMGELWRPFVRQWIPNTSLHSSAVSDQARSKLISRLEELAIEPVEKRYLNASDFGISQVADGQPFILLLDLRLFSTRQSANEREFVGELASLSEKLKSLQGLKWPPISSAEKEQVLTAWTDGDEGKPNYRKARSWLPRLISLIDPTLPIVTFSSTQDPEVLKEFAPYGNILTDFAKPVFRGILGEAEEWMGATHRSFEKALGKAVKIAAARRTIRSLETPLHRQMRTKKDAGTSAGKLVPGTLVEIFFDESIADARSPDYTPGMEGLFCVAGVIVLRDLSAPGRPTVSDHTIRLSFADKPFGLCDQLISSPQRLPKGERLNFVGNGRGINTVLDTIASIRGTLGASGSIHPFSIVGRNKTSIPWLAANDTEVFEKLDTTYRSLVRDCLDFIAYIFPPVADVLQNPKSELAIDFARRTCATSRKPAVLQELVLKFGQQEQNEDFFITLDYKDGWDYTASVIAKQGRSWPYKAKVTRARGVTLAPDSGDVGNPRKTARWPKQLHYLADWIAHLTLYHRDLVEQDLASTFAEGFVTRYCDDEYLEGGVLLDADRLWTARDQTRATILASKIAAKANAKGRQSPCPCYSDYVFSGVRLWPQRISGESLRSLFARS